mgnify:CR=1 FL=1
MPMKYQKSVANVDRKTKKKTIKHYYMKSLSKDEVLEKYFTPNKPKLKQKFRNELISNRGFTQESLQLAEASRDN